MSHMPISVRHSVSHRVSDWSQWFN